VAACQNAVETSMQRYLAGKSGDYEVLEAQLQLFPSETDVAQTQINQRAVVVQLYKALGGGWQTEPAAVPSPSR
jgi:multidrug efflux system outer membrane protein